MNLFWIDLVRIIPLASIIGYAAYKDIKYGEVSNKIWLYAPIGFVLTFLTCFIAPILFVPTLLSLVCTTATAFLVYYLGGWGGADAKAIITIGLSLPLFPSWSPLRNAPLPFSLFPFIVIFIGSVLTVAYTFHSKTNVPMKQRKIKFIPFILAALIICVTA